jgi:hypothetical protein
MSVYMLAVMAGAAVLAAWLCVRVPRLVPNSIPAAFAWVAAALGCGIAGRPLIELTRRTLGPDAAALLVVLPGSVCVFLAVGFSTLVVLRSLEPSD